MGKKLRNRQLVTETDLENEEDSNCLPLSHLISPSDIRKKVKSSLSRRKAATRTNINSKPFSTPRLPNAHD